MARSDRTSRPWVEEAWARRAARGGRAGTRATFLPPPPPTDDEVEALLRTVIHRVVDLLTRRGCLDEEAYPNDALEALQAAALQRRFPFSPDERPPPRKRRCASLEGFSLHANTHVHERDRHGLELLCRYGARGRSPSNGSRNAPMAA